MQVLFLFAVWADVNVIVGIVGDGVVIRVNVRVHVNRVSDGGSRGCCGGFTVKILKGSMGEGYKISCSRFAVGARLHRRLQSILPCACQPIRAGGREAHRTSIHRRDKSQS